MTFSRVVSLFYIIKNYLTHEENISLVVTGMPSRQSFLYNKKLLNT